MWYNKNGDSMDDILIKQEIMNLDDRELVQLFNFTVFTGLGNIGVSESEFREKLDMNCLSKFSVLGFVDENAKKSNIRNSTIHNSAEISASGMAVLKNILSKSNAPLYSKIDNDRTSLIKEIKIKYFNGNEKNDYLTIYKFMIFLLNKTDITVFDLVGLCHQPLSTDSKEQKQAKKDIRNQFYNMIEKGKLTTENIIIMLSKSISQSNIENLIDNIIDYYLEQSITVDDFINTFLNLNIDLKEKLNSKIFCIVDPQKRQDYMHKPYNFQSRNSKLIFSILDSYANSKKSLNEFLYEGLKKFDLFDEMKSKDEIISSLKSYMTYKGVERANINRYFEKQQNKDILKNFNDEYIIFYYLVDYIFSKSEDLTAFQKNVDPFLSSNLSLQDKTIYVVNEFELVSKKMPEFSSLLGYKIYNNFKAFNGRDLISKILATDTVTEEELKRIVSSVMGKKVENINIQNIVILEDQCQSICNELAKLYILRAQNNSELNFHESICNCLKKCGISGVATYLMMNESLYNYGKRLLFKLDNSEDVLKEYMGFGVQVAKPDDVIEMVCKNYVNFISDNFFIENEKTLKTLFKGKDEQILRSFFLDKALNLNFSEIKNAVLTLCNDSSLIQSLNLDDYINKTQIVSELESFCILNYLNTLKEDDTYDLGSNYTEKIKFAYILYKFGKFKEEIVPRNHHTEENFFDVSNVAIIECLGNFPFNSLFIKGNIDNLIADYGVEIIMKNHGFSATTCKFDELNKKLQVITIIRNQISHAHTKIDYERGIISFVKSSNYYEINITKLFELINLYDIEKEKEMHKFKVV